MSQIKKRPKTSSVRLIFKGRLKIKKTSSAPSYSKDATISLDATFSGFFTPRCTKGFFSSVLNLLFIGCAVRNFLYVPGWKCGGYPFEWFNLLGVWFSGLFRSVTDLGFLACLDLLVFWFVWICNRSAINIWFSLFSSHWLFIFFCCFIHGRTLTWKLRVIFSSLPSLLSKEGLKALARRKKERRDAMKEFDYLMCGWEIQLIWNWQQSFSSPSPSLVFCFCFCFCFFNLRKQLSPGKGWYFRVSHLTPQKRTWTS